ncbi:diaminopimelate decarboxylase [Alphaproteobacteria bacterium]|nr:diaminopimelate decarboxylase [Alphaproteobacteria bacterium]
MTGFVEKNNELYCDDVSVASIARKHGTPAYIYSANHIRSQYEALSGAMAAALPADKLPLICFACKANSNLAVLSVIKNCGAGLEIVSQGELVRGLRAGFKPEHIVSTGVGKTRREIAAALKAGILQFNAESVEEVEIIQNVAAEIDIAATVVFRKNPDIDGAGGHAKISTGGKRNKFGVGPEAIMRGYALAAEMSHVNVVGLSMHIGSQVFDVNKFKEAFETLPSFVAELRGAGHEVSRLDIGGGFPIQYRNETLLDLSSYAEWVRDIILPLEADLILEPGRYLVGNAGVLVSEVNLVKKTADKNFLVVDAGMTDLMRPALYDAYHGIEAVENRERGVAAYDVVGPVCESSDTFCDSETREIPALEAGDLIAIKSAGAYGFCMASNYNTRPFIPEVLVDGDKVAVINARQEIDDIFARESIPDWL